VQFEADVDGVVGIHSAVVEFDVLNLSVFVHHESGAPRPLVVVSAHGILFQNAVGSEDFVVHVAEEWERDADLLRECSVGGGTVDADAENFGVVCFELGQISLIGLQLFRSTTRESQDVEGENYCLLSTIVAQLHRL